MNRICVINTMRLGDLVQTTPLLYSLKTKYPHAELDMILLKPFQSVTDIIPYVNNFFVIDYGIISKILDEKATSTAYVYSYLIQFITDLKRKNYDLVINITPTNSALLLTKLISNNQVEGTYFDDYGYKVITNPWIHYFYITNLSRQLNSINLVDMFIKSGGMKVLPYKPYLKDKLTLQGEDPSYYCIHLGASERKRSIEPEILAKAANIICRETGLKVCLLGVDAESDLAERFLRAFKGESINLVGKTSVKELAEVIANSAFLICHDTGPMHIAWASGKKVVSIFIATANPFETGPYGPGHIVLQPTLPCYPCDHAVTCHTLECKRAIKEEQIATAALALLTEEDQGLLKQKEARVMKSTQAIDGMAELIPVSPIPWSKDIFAMLCWRSVVPEILDLEPDMERILHNLRSRTWIFFEKDPLNLRTNLKTELERLAEGLWLTESAVKTCERILRDITNGKMTLEKIIALTGQLSELEGLLGKWSCINKRWELPINMLNLSLRTFVTEPDMKVTAEKTLNFYKLAYEQMKTVYDIIKNI